MDWTHLFVSNEDPGGNGAGSLDTDPSLLVATSDFFENLPFPPTSIPPRPPSIPADLEPAPLFPQSSDSSNALEAAFLSAQQPYATHSANALGLRFDSGSAVLNSTQVSSLQQQQQQQVTQADRQQEQPVLQPASNTLFDSKEESYLNSFLSGFDIDGLDIAPYLASPLPMANFSSRTDFTSMGMGIGVGAGMMGAMDDAIPHLSLDDSRNDAASGLTHMAPPSASIGGTRSHTTAGTAGGAVPMRRQASMFDYSLGSTSQLSLGNVISDEMHKVSSWLLQNQDHHGEPPHPQSTAFPDIAAMSQRLSFDMRQSQSQSPHPSLSSAAAMLHLVSPTANASVPVSSMQQQRTGALSMEIPAALSQGGPHTATGSMWRTDFMTDASIQSPRPPSESDMSIKRKASFEQLDQPRKTRGSMRSPMRDAHSPFSASAGTDGMHLALSRPPTILEAASAGSIAGRRSMPQSAFGTGHGSRHAGPGMAGEEYVALGGNAPEEDDDNDDVGEDSTAATAGKDGKRKESKKSMPRAVLTEEERRANHIASEQRRRNQIRHGYAELMTLVTTLRDPALGNHPGTAHSTPSKAVILAHAVQFIRGLEEGNRMLRKRLEQSHHLLPPMHMPSHALSGFHPGSPTPPQQ
ncbi:hypothetical protein IW140_004920 [Coemansia sp. RSA 1813]|nr:hypothetical protein EV178_005213 [Coemansia sp. RSA 1646]KAJ1771919.1 hypothetical protein LPJ74_001953 [Coemansia sp. RSA 1843]KAJ2087382.1 hypothetical protein IW138_004999 [Coemansia sp. RSA 986]KAJ2212253.1 hypothetical protein EV179_004804 [Coemansia sp. RSA 487]KAJ2566451.1 hypothetical protein IW140_004920 [Coemansia sp. RSA 1813]